MNERSRLPAMQGLNDIRQVDLGFYTRNTHTTRKLASTHWRFSDTLNALDQDFLLINEATLQTLEAGNGDEFVSPTLLVRTTDIILAIPGQGGGRSRHPRTERAAAD